MRDALYIKIKEVHVPPLFFVFYFFMIIAVNPLMAGGLMLASAILAFVLYRLAGRGWVTDGGDLWEALDRLDRDGAQRSRRN